MLQAKLQNTPGLFLFLPIEAAGGLELEVKYCINAELII